ncbi:MAG: SDR family oxidoreductase [Gammaproteobacteria bacterium]
MFETMRSKGGGTIINLSSIYGLVGAPHAAAYQANKRAVRLFSKGAAAEYAEFGIRVNSLHPGVIDTPMAHHLPVEDEVKNAVLGPTLLKRAGFAEEIAPAVLFLASDESSFVVGSEMVVDGGYSAN